MKAAGRNGIARDLIDRRIFYIRDQRVILDVDLADIYEVGTQQLGRQVRRNIARFPAENAGERPNHDHYTPPATRVFGFSSLSFAIPYRNSLFSQGINTCRL